MKRDIRQVVRLGGSGLEVSRLGFGCMSLSHLSADERSSLVILRRAAELGVTFFDTADRDGHGHTERLIGRFATESSAELVLATKFGLLDGTGEQRRVDGRPEYVQGACDASLRRLGVESIDLYYLHRADPAVPIEDTVGAMAALVTAGKVRALGLSAVPPPLIRRAHAVHEIAAVQNEYSLWSREPEGSVLDTCRELGITFVASSPLTVGLLARAARQLRPGSTTDRSQRARKRRLGPHDLERYLELLGRLAAVARDLGCGPAQVALAWLLAQGPDVVPVPATRDLAHLAENAGARQIEFSPDQLSRLAGQSLPTASPALRR